MQLTLEMRHVCPTAPDTLRAFPYISEDPFVVYPSQAPHVYFTGNHSVYAERLIYSSATKQAVKLLAVPEFRHTRSIILLDLSTLESYEVKFEIGEGIKPVRDSAAVDMEIDS